MAPESPQRRLAAILSADVAGYSRLMGADEAATVATLTAYRRVFTERIAAHHGSVVDAKGDAILAEFASVVDAVACAAAIQRELSERNAGLPESRAMHFRIGINLGDVLVQDGAIYGDGVNIAARLEALAEPGGLCISRSAYDQVEGKLDLAFDDLGEQRVKNIARPVRALAVKLTGEFGVPTTPPRPSRIPRWKVLALGAAALIVLAGIVATIQLSPGARDSFWLSFSEERAPEPGNPSIAVLPFVNMSGDPAQDHFADGLSDILMTDLSKIRNLSVAARNSVFRFKEKPVEITWLAGELGVGYVLEGAVQKAGDRIRVNAQLIDGATGDHLWAERYDRPLTDIFAVQDEISRAIVTELNVTLVQGEYARLFQAPDGNVRAQELVMQGINVFRDYTRDGVATAERTLKLALDVDPKNAVGHTFLGWVHYFQASHGWSPDAGESFAQALESAQKAMTLDPDGSFPLTLMGFLRIEYLHEAEPGLADLRRAVELNPNNASSVGILAWVLATWFSRGEEALELARQAMQIGPVPLDFLHGALGAAYRVQGRYDEAIRSIRRCTGPVPDYLPCRFELTVALIQAGREDEAREQARQVLRIHPRFVVDDPYFIGSIPDPALRGQYEAAMRRAGLP